MHHRRTSATVLCRSNCGPDCGPPAGRAADGHLAGPHTMGIPWHRGTEWALNQERAFRDEVKQRAERQLWTCPDGYLRYGTQDPLRCLASRYTTLHRQQLRVSAETGRMGGPDRTGSPVARRVSGGLASGSRQSAYAQLWCSGMYQSALRPAAICWTSPRLCARSAASAAAQQSSRLKSVSAWCTVLTLCAATLR